MIREIYATTLLSLAVAGSAAAQSLGDMVVRPVVVTSKHSVDNLAKGVSLFSKQQYAAALMLFDKALIEGNLTKQNRDVIEFLQALSRGKLMKENTLTIIKSYIDFSTNPVLKNEALLVVATAFIEVGDFVDAAEVLGSVDTKILNKMSRSSYYYLVGYLDLNAGERKAAYENFEKSLEVESDRSELAQYYMAYIDYLDGKLERAALIFETLAAKPQYIEANLYLLQIRFLQRDFTTVVTDGAKVIEMPLSEASKAEATRLMGEAYFNLGNYANAVRYIEKYDTMGGKMTRELYYQIGYSYYMQNMYKKATEQFVKIIEGQDALAQNAYYHLADAYLKIGDKSGAMQAFSMAASFSFEKEMAQDALYNYAKLTYESAASNLYSKKIDVLKKYIDTYPSTERANEIRGYLLTLYLNSSNFDAAMGELGKVKNPNDQIKAAVQRLCYQKATSYFNNGDYKKAVELLDKSLSYPISPKYVALASFWKAESLFKQGIYDSSVINLYNKYLRVAQPTMREYKMAYYNIGYVYFNNEQWAEAVSAFEKFISVYKTDDAFLEDAYLRLGDAMFARKMYSAAQLYYKKASAVGILNSDYADFQCAMSEGLMGRDDLKIKTLKSIADNEQSQMRDRATVALANTYIKTGKSAEGVTVLEKMTSEKRVSPYMAEAMLELGVAYSNSGKDDKALTKYKELVKDYPQSSEAKDALVAIKAIYVSKGDAQGYIAYIDSMDGEGGIDAGEKEALSYDALQRQFIAGNFDRVVDLSDDYKKEFPNGVHLVDVEYYLSESLIATKSDKAIGQLETLIAMPNSQYTIAGLENVIKLYAAKSMSKEQHGALMKLYTISANPSQKKDALENLMELAVRIAEAPLVTSSAEVVFADKDASEKAVNYARFGNGRELYNKGDYAGAVKELSKVTIPASKAEGVQCKFLLADAMFRGGDVKGSEKVVIELSNLETPHQYWVARGFILYGDIYKKKGDLFQAKATYQSILEGYEKKTDGILETVKARLEELKNNK